MEIKKKKEITKKKEKTTEKVRHSLSRPEASRRVRAGVKCSAASEL